MLSQTLQVKSNFKLSSPKRAGSFLFNIISCKLLYDFIQVMEDFSETSKKLF